MKSGLASIALFAALVFQSPSASASIFGDSFGLSPFWSWKTIESEHFKITFPEELEAVAGRSADYLEQAHLALKTPMAWEPRQKVQVLVIDNYDTANGLTAAVLRFGMVLYVTPPENWYSTAYHDQWLKLLAFHEYTHYLNLDATRDFYDVIRVLFGDTFLPNGLWPRWMLEGLAVYTETLATESGRGRSTYYEMILRAAVQEKLLGDSRFITLDEVNGTNPRFPLGETAYLFGYHLLNQVSRDVENRKPKVYTSGFHLLGEMSRTSSGRIPFFINGNLENLTGKDFYQYWNEWLSETTARAERKLAEISKEPVSKHEVVIDGVQDLFGAEVSPDGKFIAYSRDEATRRRGLHVFEIATAKNRRIDDKMGGVSLGFTPDSKTIIFSSMERRGQYYLHSDLFAMSVEGGSKTRLSSHQRLKDPDVSRDGNWVVFTKAAAATTGLARAPLVYQDGKYSLGRIEELFVPPTYARVSQPRFSKDGKSVFFAYHDAKSPEEKIMRFDLESGKTETLVSNGAFNRFTHVSDHGDLYFTSDLGGVDNIYRYDGRGKTTRITNVTTGAWFPFVRGQTLYSSRLAALGWQLVRYDLKEVAPLQSKEKTPAPKSLALAEPEQRKYPVRGYNPLPTLLPRQWAPVFLLDQSGARVGGLASGFDALDLHNYVLAATYDTDLKLTDTLAMYSNRMLGAMLTLTGSQQTGTRFFVNNEVTRYTRRTRGTASLSYPILFTFSSVTPEVTYNLEREKTYRFNGSSSQFLFSRWRNLPSLDALISIRNVESNPLAISEERGYKTVLGGRRYFELQNTTVRGLVSHSQYLHVAPSVVAVPSVRAIFSSQPRAATLSGRSTGIFDPFFANDLDQLSIRGYPYQNYYVRSAQIGAFDLRFPLFRIFRGFGTNPLFFENLYGVGFYESAYLPKKEYASAMLNSTGGGMRLETSLLNLVPVVMSLEYHYGFKRDQGGIGELFFAMNLGQFSF